MTAHICSPSTWLLRQEDHELVTSLCYVEKLCIKTHTHTQPKKPNFFFLKMKTLQSSWLNIFRSYKRTEPGTYLQQGPKGLVK